MKKLLLVYVIFHIFSCKKKDNEEWNPTKIAFYVYDNISKQPIPGAPISLGIVRTGGWGGGGQGTIGGETDNNGYWSTELVWNETCTGVTITKDEYVYTSSGCDSLTYLYPITNLKLLIKAIYLEPVAYLKFHIRTISSNTDRVFVVYPGVTFQGGGFTLFGSYFDSIKTVSAKPGNHDVYWYSYKNDNKKDSGWYNVTLTSRDTTFLEVNY